jgi:DNA-binding transcriptional ArsR family regulator
MLYNNIYYKKVNYIFNLKVLMTQIINIEVMRESADIATSLMKVLANPDRLILLCQLSEGEKSVGELETLTSIKQPTLSQQLTVLRENQVVQTRREGKNIFYSVKSQPALAIIKVLAEQLCNPDKQ